MRAFSFFNPRRCVDLICRSLLREGRRDFGRLRTGVLRLVAVGTMGLVLVGEIVAQSANYNYQFTTLVGPGGGPGTADGVGGAARFENPTGVATDGSGNTYVVDSKNYTIRKITAAGVVTTFAGLAGSFGSADGVGSAARFGQPNGIAVDGSGNVYVADLANGTIRKITPAGLVSTFAGTAGMTGSADGVGAAARFKAPAAVAVDGAGTLYVADSFNFTVRKITAAGVVSTLAGSAESSGTADGVGAAARFSYPQGVAVDGAGNVYVADSSSHTIRKITSTGVVSTLAGLAGNRGSQDGVGAAASFYIPQGVAVDGSGTIYVADTLNHTIRKISASGTVSTLAGLARSTGNADGTGAAARFFSPPGIAVDGSGNVFVADYNNHMIRKITAAGVVTTLAGRAIVGSADGSGAAVQFNSPTGGAIDGNGPLYVADSGNHTIRKITADGVATTFAGLAGASGSADGTGAIARFNDPRGVAVDVNGNIFVADRSNYTIRKITPSGSVTTLAGLAGVNGHLDGVGAAARFVQPSGVAVDGVGNVYVVDGGSTIRKITADGTVSTLAGTLGAFGSADGVGATARFNSAAGIAVDGIGTVYVADTYNHTIRKISSAGEVTTLAGLAGVSGTAVGTGSTARFNAPTALAVDGTGTVFVADMSNHSIRRVTPAGVVTTLAGTSAGIADGVGIAVRFNSPQGVAVDRNGVLYVVDTSNYRVRVGLLAVAPTIAQQPLAQIVEAGQTATMTVLVTGTAPLAYQWKKDGVSIDGATGVSYAKTSAQVSDAGSYTVVVTNAVGTVTSEPAALVVIPTGTSVAQAVTRGGYTAGGVATVLNTITFPAGTTSVRWQVQVPTGWSYAFSSGSQATTAPVVGATGLVEWVWDAPSASPIRFSYTLNVPANASGPSVIAGNVVLLVSGASIPIKAQPESLTFNAAAGKHTADTDGDGRISLAELTRVLELYNARAGTLRTGRYQEAVSATEDGFEVNATNGPGAVTRRHAADVNSDGRLSLTEITRVIELFNARSGLARTGAYHEQSGTEDGFAPGP